MAKPWTTPNAPDGGQVVHARGLNLGREGAQLAAAAGDVDLRAPAVPVGAHAAEARALGRRARAQLRRQRRVRRLACRQRWTRGLSNQGRRMGPMPRTHERRLACSPRDAQRGSGSTVQRVSVTTLSASLPGAKERRPRTLLCGGVDASRRPLLQRVRHYLRAVHLVLFASCMSGISVPTHFRQWQR